MIKYLVIIFTLLNTSTYSQEMWVAIENPFIFLASYDSQSLKYDHSGTISLKVKIDYKKPPESSYEGLKFNKQIIHEIIEWKLACKTLGKQIISSEILFADMTSITIMSENMETDIHPYSFEELLVQKLCK